MDEVFADPITYRKPDMAAHICYPSAPMEKQELETGESQRATEGTAANKVEGEEPTLEVDF